MKMDFTQPRRWRVLLILLLSLLLELSGAENLQAPRFTSQPASANSITSEGRTKILQCQAQGNPRLEFRWLKDGHPLTDYLPEHFYKIQSLRREDAGNFSCIAKNEVGAIFSNKFDVSVAYMGQFEDVEEKTQVVQYGSAAILDLPVIESHPSPSVTWQTEDAPVPYDRKYVVTLKNQLVILAAEESDEKAYRARATNTQLGKEENSGFIRLTVDKDNLAKGFFDDTEDNDQPTIIIGPTDLHIIKGQSSAELECIANSRYLHELSTIWLKDGIPLENAGVQFSFNDVWNRTLSLLSIEPGHSGQYICKAGLRSNRGNQPIEVEASATITVLEKPLFTSNLRPEFYSDFASPVTLPCHATGVPKPEISWYRNTEPLSMLMGSRFDILEDGSLTIKSVAVEDSGMFQCLAKNEAGEQSVYTWLRVKTSAPLLTMPPTNATVLAGKDATINCRAKGAPAPTTSWILKTGETLKASQDRFSVLESGDILISAVQSSDAGMYTCIQTNEAGKNESSAWLIVLVQPQILQPPVDTKIILGHTATFQCKVSSDHSLPFTVTWKKNGQLIDTSRTSRIQQTSDGMLEIKEVRAADVGEYTCFLSTSGGNDSRSARLEVIELPYAPGAVSAFKIEKTKTVNVSWTAGFDGNSPILKYIVQKREVQNNADLLPLTPLSWSTELANISATDRSVILPYLKAAASYQFRVSAVNSVGEGNPSDPSDIVALPQERPSGPPQGLVGSARSSSEIIIQWQPPIEKHHNGILMGYMIRYRLFGYIDSPWSYRNVTNEAQRNYLIQELITWKDYEIQVAAYNDKGVGIFSDSIKIKTKEGVPEDAPSKVRAKALNSTAVQVWWTPPDPQKINGINQGYKLQAWKDTISETSESIVRTVPPNLLDPLAEQTTILENLDKYALYHITVLCFTDPGDGDKSLPIKAHTMEDVPGPVAKLQFDEVSDRAVTVSWGVPPSPNGILVGYVLKYMVKDKSDTEQTFDLDSNSTSKRIEGLQATTHYRFEIKALTGVGSGEAVSATIQSGIEPVLPTAPTHLAVTNIEAFSVMLQFTPGFDGNSSIIKWIVEGQTARATTWSVLVELSDPDATTIFIKTLLPFMQYKLRLTAVNVVGASPPSEPTKDFQTIQAPPKHSPKNVTVRAVSATELRVRWIPLQQLEWFGNPRGYNISSTTKDGITKLFVIEDHTANSHILSNLEESTEYTIQMCAFNDVGASGLSPPAKERTRESVPSSGPNHVEANATSSTTIVVKWGDVPKGNENGVIEGFKVFYGALPKVPFKNKVIPKNSTHTTTLTELKKYVSYNIQVMAYTRLGDGVLSMPPVQVKTFEDSPGPPSNVSFPDVSFSTARIIWDVPEDPNGEILAYRVSYHLEDNINFNYSREFPPSDRTFRATELEPEQYYMFSVRAQTRLGWGKTAQALVYTTNNREPPEAPSMPQISRSQVQSEQIIFSWTPGRDGFAPLRYYTVQKAEGADGPWTVVAERVDPQLSYYTVTGLKPYTAYKFRIQATNDLGPSGWSQPSALFKTLPAAPSQGVTGLKVVPITTTSVRVHWEPIPESFWSGDHQTGGYRISYQQVLHYASAMQTSPSIQVPGVLTKDAILDDLSRDATYEIVLTPYNSQGLGPFSPPITVYVGEAVPTGKPRELTAEAVSPTEVRLNWKPPPQSQQNGELLGYKIFYVVTGQPALANSKEYKKPQVFENELEVVAAPSTSHSLVFLDQFTTYQISIVAFNPAGDGPPSAPVTVTTLEGLPGPPANLSFVDITMNSLLVTWNPPLNRNGKIMGYLVSYETAENDERFTKQVKQKVSDATSLLIQGLEEEVTYTFIVRSLTFDYGPASTANVTTGPQDGSPLSIRELSLTRTLASVELSWINGAFVKQPILGYYVESQRKDDTRWQIVAKTKTGPARDYSVSYQNLLPSTAYKFRVIAYNKYGVSYPTYTKDNVITPSKLYLEYGYLQFKPFYRQSWFMVVLAATSVIVIVAIIAILCVKSKSYKYKQEAQSIYDKTIKADGDDINDPSIEMSADVPYQPYSQSLLGTNRSGRSRASAVFGKTPPRPRPASVAYNSDDDSVKGYDENPDDSSVTEKPSEISSTDSQETESDNDSEGTPPPSFVNHYANINDSLRQSWKRQKPIRNYSSYTDSEPEPYISTRPQGSDYEAASSSAAASILNGGQIVMNNKARSRAPLPGFSSFV